MSNRFDIFNYNKQPNQLPAQISDLNWFPKVGQFLMRGWNDKRGMNGSNNMHHNPTESVQEFL